MFREKATLMIVQIVSPLDGVHVPFSITLSEEIAREQLVAPSATLAALCQTSAAKLVQEITGSHWVPVGALAPTLEGSRRR
jgi:hypothetical protein